MSKKIKLRKKNDSSDSESEFSPYSSEDDDYDNKSNKNRIIIINCINPLCDHIKRKKKEKYYRPKEINTIKDFITLGKEYHCKNNTHYGCLNLKTLCKLVAPLTELENMIGLDDIKKKIVNHIIYILSGYNLIDKCNNCNDCYFNRRCNNKGNIELMHTIITGPPGVGKTELGKILGKIYKSVGLLTNNIFKVARRSDLIAKYLGQTAIKTQKLIDECKGGVLFIDEAYSLGNQDCGDSYSKECIDTINQNLTEKKDFLCIIAGYEESLESSFFSYNQGLKRRFPFSYNIKSYTSKELLLIFKHKVSIENWKLDISNDDLLDFFNLHIKDFPYFGGDIEVFFMQCKISNSKRTIFTNVKKKLILNDLILGLELFKNKNKKTDDIIPTMYI
jgi:SpoVK/Ycf46/Vps4 family AAA+-type ATPase